jgi:hypothetical protein
MSKRADGDSHERADRVTQEKTYLTHACPVCGASLEQQRHRRKKPNDTFHATALRRNERPRLGAWTGSRNGKQRHLSPLPWSCPNRPIAGRSPSGSPQRDLQETGGETLKVLIASGSVLLQKDEGKREDPGEMDRFHRAGRCARKTEA